MERCVAGVLWQRREDLGVWEKEDERRRMREGGWEKEGGRRGEGGAKDGGWREQRGIAHKGLERGETQEGAL